MKIFILSILASCILFFKASGQKGCIIGDCYNGIGTYIWDDGSEYTGQWQYGARTGLGAFDWPDGSYYYGYFLNGALEGRGFYLAKEKENDLIGTFHEGKLSEQGSFEPTGCLLGDCKNGVGVYVWESNDVYIGEWVDGSRTGYGRYDWANGALYTGHFKDNLLDGKGTYIDPDGKEMNGEFIKNEFQQPVVQEKKEATIVPVVKSEPLVSDFCTVMIKVTDEYTKNFESLMKEKEPDEGYSLGDTWISSARVSGTNDAKVSVGWLGAHNTWYNVLYESSDLNEARSKYQDYINIMKSCSPACCTMVSSENVYDKDDYKSYTTSWLTFLVKDDFDTAYEEMVIDIELSSQVISEGYQVLARVKEFKRD